MGALLLWHIFSLFNNDSPLSLTSRKFQTVGNTQTLVHEWRILTRIILPRAHFRICPSNSAPLIPLLIPDARVFLPLDLILDWLSGYKARETRSGSTQ